MSVRSCVYIPGRGANPAPVRAWFLAFGLGFGGCVGGDAPKDPFDVGGSGKAGTSSAGKAGSSSAGKGGTEAGSSARAGSSGQDAGAAGSGGSAEIVPGSKQSHYPIVVGSTWTYHHTNPTKQPWDEIDMIETATYMDKPASALTDEEDGQGEKTRSLLVVQGSGVYRVYKEVAVAGQVAVKVAYDPGFLRYDEAWTKGQTVTLDDGWTQTCVFSSSAAKCAPGAVKPGTTTHIYKVVETDTEVTVPAGTFKAVEIERTNPGDNETKRFWFAVGVGKVREFDVTSGAIEELTEYHIP